MATAAQIETPRAEASRDLWRIGDALVLLAYAGVVLWTIRYHEKWADEAQAWLIARDLDLPTIWFHELRYEGSPGLWHTILWIAQHVFGLGYGALGYIGAAFAIAGAAVLIFFAPFPRYIRWPLAFTYVMVYQYAVIARPYALYPLLAFLAALFFKDSLHPERITAVLILLILLTLHGVLLAVCLGVAYLYEAIQMWPALEKPIRRKYFVCMGAIAAVLLFVAVIVKPTSDVEEIAIKDAIAHASVEVKAAFPSIEQKVVAVISGTFIDYFFASLVLVVSFGVWCFWRRKGLAFGLSVGLLVAFYIAIHGAAHHHGTIFIAAVAGLWIAWPTESEESSFNDFDRKAAVAVKGMLLALCAFNIWDASVVIKREYLYPYCGAADAAQYLRSVGADRGPMFGFLFGVVAVQAYFDHNIFINNPHSYFHHGLPLKTTQLEPGELEQIKPEYVVAYSMDPKLMMESGVPQVTSRGYDLVHFSDGYYLYKRGVFEREVYFIFRRSANAPAKWPAVAGTTPDFDQTRAQQ
jgi:hypothetical protein